MQTKVQKSELIQAIKANREKHVTIVKEAQEGYKKEIIALLEKMLIAAREGKRVSHKIDLIMPVSHLDDYDRVLRMLEMSDEDVIIIEEYEFGKYVHDQWEWKRNFLQANRGYSFGARSECDTLPRVDGY